MIGNRPWEIVTEPDYFRNVMGTMVTAGLGRKADLWVRFGKLGTGQKPNYQVHSPDGRVIRYSGTSHKVFHEHPYVSFEPENSRTKCSPTRTS